MSIEKDILKASRDYEAFVLGRLLAFVAFSTGWVWLSSDVPVGFVRVVCGGLGVMLLSVWTWESLKQRRG